MPRPTTVRGVLLAAARLIERRGWGRHRLEDDQGRLCVAGAINVAVRGSSVHFWRPARRAALADRALCRLDDRLGGDAIRWNNSPTRTQAEVVTALRAAAKGAPR